MSPPPVSDSQLIARIVVSDDRHAFSELVRRHQSSVRATLRKLAGGNAALADDLAQEAFLLAYRNLKSFRQDAKFSTWLYRIAYNVFLADARKIKELPMPEDMDVDVLSPAGAAVPGHRKHDLICPTFRLIFRLIFQNRRWRRLAGRHAS
jgi:DNA-directed RNA polymerase specialized sigma24 family protein